jgi:hypothetical protein
VTGGKPIAVRSQSISGGSAVNPLVAFYDIHGRKREVLFFYFVPETNRDSFMDFIISFIKLLLTLLSYCFVIDSLTIQEDNSRKTYIRICK